VRFNFERGKSCRYSTYTYSKQLGEFLRVGEGGPWPTPAPPKSATVNNPPPPRSHVALYSIRSIICVEFSRVKGDLRTAELWLEDFKLGSKVNVLLQQKLTVYSIKDCCSLYTQTDSCNCLATSEETSQGMNRNNYIKNTQNIYYLTNLDQYTRYVHTFAVLSSRNVNSVSVAVFSSFSKLRFMTCSFRIATQTRA